MAEPVEEPAGEHSAEIQNTTFVVDGIPMNLSQMAEYRRNKQAADALSMKEANESYDKMLFEEHGIVPNGSDESFGRLAVADGANDADGESAEPQNEKIT